jgi:tRNA (guanine-N7-)-methyltransferase
VIAQSPKSLTTTLDLEEIFGRKAPLHVDLGCGDGAFLCALAQRAPDKDFIGIERLSRRVRSAAQKAGGLTNVRLLQIESSYAVRYLLPPQSVEIFYLLFPDPWPKRRHHPRRIVTPDFLNSVHLALKGDGLIYFATDHVAYFEHIKAIAELTPNFTIANADADLPQSTFSFMFQRKGTPINWLVLRKVSPVM